MTQDERNLLGRIEERTANIWTLTERIESHLRELNGSVAKNCIDIAKNKTMIRFQWWAIGGIIVALGTLAGILLA